jgi:hypothetical protein
VGEVVKGVSEQAADIVAIILETGTKTRRERAAFVAKLRDEMGLSFREIGRQVNVSPQRAQQLYRLNKYFARSANSPFANLSTRARHFLDNVAGYKGLGQDWEQDPAKIAALVHHLTNMTKTEAFKFRQLGQHTFQEIADFMQSQGVQFPWQFEEAMEDDVAGKDVTGAAVSIEQGMQQLTRFLNEKGFAGEFKVWPPGTYKGPHAENAEFVITLSEFLADAWEEQWQPVAEFDALAKGLMLHYEMATRSVLTFYRDTYFDPGDYTPPQQPEQMPEVNLRDVTFD